MAWSYKWEGKLDFYYSLEAKNSVRPEDRIPNLKCVGSISAEIEPFALYLEAFQELSTCRPSGFGVSPIPFVAIVEYAKLYGIEGEEFHDFLYVIRSMDSEVMRLESKKQSGKNGTSGSKGNNRKG